ncbi:MAG: hypothetical protein GY821_06415 [Gammaproteobacteria bacterium]|nr:hypothetical protein [Gammaproteobacteria bacterium]
MDDVFQGTVQRRLQLESRGLKVVEKWECQLRKELKADPEMADFFDGIELVGPMDARDAFYGGRTNSAKLYHKCQGQEKIFYYDYTR